jgi:xanthine dehydrogenase small subunit
MRQDIRFLLNGQPQRVSNAAGDQTLLGWLREQPHLRGTKQGCGEGDCGACTVALGRPDESGQLVWSPINACILFLPMVDGAAIRTVDGLAAADGQLHPVQAAMVAADAAQCGFCTPGFVMSLYVAWQNRDGLGQDSIDDTLAGNLCRCTGYRAIVSAALALAAPDVHSPADRSDAAEAAALAALCAAGDHDDDLVVDQGATGFYAPTTPAAFADFYAENPESVIVAGATDVGLWVTKQHRTLGQMLWTGRVPQFDRMVRDDDRLFIGPAVTHQRFADAIAADLPELAELMRRFAAQQVRSSGTICGNIANASPIGDLPPALIALGSAVELTRQGAVRQLALEDFFIAYGQQDRAAGEFVSGIYMPAQPAPHLRCYKISKRFDQDISAVMLAANVDIVDGVITAPRLAFGGMAAIPKRAAAAEAALIGKPVEMTTFQQAAVALADDFTPLSDMRGSAAYRMATAQNLLVKYGLDLSEGQKFRLAGAGLASVMERW